VVQERGGPRHLRGERGDGAGRVYPDAPPPPGEERHQAGGTDTPYDYNDDQEHMDQLA
jgi:hypothetical protein